MKIGHLEIGSSHPCRFIAEIGANHDGQLDRALTLIRLAAEAGADIVKFQHFRAPHIVSREAFDAMPKIAHQASWGDSVYEVYERCSLPWEWTPMLALACQERGVIFMSTPYDLDAVAHLDPYVPAWKVGSGDITYFELLRTIARTGKPVLLSTGASNPVEMWEAAELFERGQFLLMQCVTNYTGDPENVKHANLRALEQMRGMGLTHEAHVPVGLSDHTRSPEVVLGAVALGACVIERHFTDHRFGDGPDHAFAMEPDDFRDMIEDVRILESAMGDWHKKVYPCEYAARIVQRRCWRAARDLPAATVLMPGDLQALRPCPAGAIPPTTPEAIIGRKLAIPMKRGEALTAEHLA